MKDWWTTARANPLFRLTGIVLTVVMALDQASKLWILHGLRLQERPFGHLDLSPVLDFTYVENRGVSFGMFAGGMTSRIVLTLLAITVAAYVLKWAGRLTRRVAAVGAGLIVGGALGNAIDRIAYGYVVDFLDLSPMGFPWQFNIADVAINMGVACLLWDAFVDAPKREKAAAIGRDATKASLAADDDLNETKGREGFRDADAPPITSNDTNTRSAE